MKKIDPYFDLIMDEDLAENKYPRKLDEHHKKAKQSLMAQVMNREIFERLKDTKTNGGWTIAKAINTGVCYPTSFLGCHVGDLESYTTFKDLFHPIVEKYHRVDMNTLKHVTDMDPEKITCDLSESAKAKIISTRIRCARNISAFPLNTIGTKESRLAIADAVEKAFKGFDDDLAGSFYRHTTMTPEETQKLVDDHFLFRGKDKMQAASGYHQFWPEGRGIFCSKDKKFLLWVNEGDHLRIISMERGNDVKGVLGRLHRGAAAVEKELQKQLNQSNVFLSDPKLGMITCCPTNIGSGMRGSVHIMVPNLIEKIGFEKLDEIARSMNCQARGSTGEHSEVIDRIDISNWRRLGVPEYQLVEDMIKCANAMAELEDNYVNIDPYFDLIMDDDLAENKYPRQLDEHHKKEKQSLMAQVMNREMFERLKTTKTKGGWTIAKAINTGVCYPTSFLGCHVGDLESYTTFKDLFHPIVEKYHRVDMNTLKHVTDMDPEKITCDLSESAKTKIISTRIRCARNIAAFPLNTIGTKESRLAIADSVEKAFKGFDDDLAGSFYRHTTMTPEETQKLVDDHFLFRGKDKMQAASGYHQFWPEGRGIFCSKDKKFLLWVNEGDHLRIISMERGNDVKGVLGRLHRGAAAVEKELQKQLDQSNVFLSDPKLGMITCCPTNIGSGMRGSVHIMVPNLIEKIGFEKLDEIARSMNCQARGSTGEHSEVIDRIDISNWRRLGVPEYQLVEDMIKCANAMAELEDKYANIDPYFDLIMDADLAENKYPRRLDEHHRKEKQSLMAQVMNRELFEQLKDKTTKGGWTIAKAINTGVCYPTSFLGCHVGDLESYTTFKDLFHPIVEKYHRVDMKTLKHVTDMDPEKLTCDLSESAKGKIISTRIRCARNIAAFPLNTIGTKESRLSIADAVEKAFKGFDDDLAGSFYRHTTMTPEETQKLVDDHFLFRGKDKMQAASGYHQFWPEGRGIFCSKDKKFLLWVNEGDHLRIISMEKGNDVKGVLGRLHRGAAVVEKELQKQLNQSNVFLSDPKLGMVTCCPTNIGSGMRGSVHIMVPNCIEKIGFEKLDEIARSMNCQARGSTGEHSEVIDRIDISNWRRLGVPEYQLVEDMIRCANAMAELEDNNA